MKRWVAGILHLAVAAISPAAFGASAATPEGLSRREVESLHAYRPGPGPNGVSVNAATTLAQLLQAFDIDPATVTSPSITGHMNQYAAFPSLGTLVSTTGGSFAWLSTGVAGAGTPQTVDPGAFGTQSGTDMETTCAGASGYDCVTLRFSFLVPVGMHSVQFDFNMLSVEYPEYVDQGYNDEFTVQLSSPSNNYPNIVFDAYGNPINIDSAFFNQPCTSLTGTGFDIFSGSQCDAGATGLLTTSAPVTEGEVVTMTFSLRDQGDGIFDTAVMLDRFVLSTETVTGPGTESEVKIDYLSPKSGHIAGGTQVIIHGEGFENVQSVRFDGVPALYQPLDPYTLVILTPPHSAGAVDVAITAAPGGGPGTTGVKPAGFTYYTEPPGSELAVMSVDPPEGPKDGGVHVAIRGSGFTVDTVISFDGVAILDAQLINGDEIVVRTPSGSGSVHVRATNANGDSAVLQDGYVYIGPGGDGPGCRCDLSPAAAGNSMPVAALALITILGLAIAAMRRRALAGAAALVLLSGCANETDIVLLNSPPSADAGPDTDGFVGSAVSLDGTSSADREDGNNLVYAWTVVSRPANSTAELLDATVAQPVLVPDEAGLYRIGLVVIDQGGVGSGDIGWGGTPDDNLVDVVVLPFNDFRVTLTWDTDASDLDLHLIRSDPGENWIGLYWNHFGGVDDCFYGLPMADWGSTGVSADNAELTEDVDTGFGPEAIAIGSPQDVGRYTIVAHMFNAHGAGPTLATAKLEVDGIVVAEVTSTLTLDGTDALWVAGSLDWPANAFSVIDLMTTHQNVGGPPH